MVDFLKLIWLRANIAAIRKNKRLSFYTKVDAEGCIQYEEALYRKLTFTIRGNAHLEIKGSIHEYWKGSNHTEFKHIELIQAICDLGEKFGLPLDEVKIQNIEIGVNFKPPVNSTLFLDSIFRYKARNFSVRRFGGKGYQLEQVFQRYFLKIYDKGKDCKLNYELIRFELKVIKMPHIEYYGLKTLGDLLNLEKLNAISKELLETIDSFIMGNPYTNTKSMSKREKNTFTQLNTRSVWERFSANYQKNRKTRFNEVIAANSYKVLQEEFKAIVASVWGKLAAYTAGDEKALFELINKCKMQKGIAELTTDKIESYSPINRYSIVLKELQVLQACVLQQRCKNEYGLYVAKCAECGELMVFSRIDKIYCSNECSCKQKRQFRAELNEVIMLKKQSLKNSLIPKDLGY